MIDKIHDVFIKDLFINIDDRGSLFELLRIDWNEVEGLCWIEDLTEQRIQQIYIVQNHNDAIRAFHKHQQLADIFCLIKGHAKFVLIDDRLNSISRSNTQIINVSDKKLQIIGVPPGVYHGWRGSRDCILVSVANKLYCGRDRKEELDEERILWDQFGKEIWGVNFK
jgi:dTDP-4-dehydrorhamnose 3,5-epimerase